MSQPLFKLANGFDFARLQDPVALAELDRDFLARLKATDSTLHSALIAWRENPDSRDAVATSALLLACAPVLEEFVAELFGVTAEVTALRASATAHDPVFAFKETIVKKRAKRRLQKAEECASFSELDTWLEERLDHTLTKQDRELAVATFAQSLRADEATHAAAIEKLTQWCVRAMTDPQGQHAVADWTSFHLPASRDPAHLVPLQAVAKDPARRTEGLPQHYRRRDGFGLTDSRMDARAVQSEIDYCIYCHDHDGDFCSKGFPKKKGDPAQGLKVDPLGVTLTGCPLDEKISEMHLLKRDGLAIAALAMIMVDNPMCPATGHRICNDCMKACIYQKQDPVNIPQIETRCLTDVLGLPWGVEIYDLLTRWNPLRPRQWVARPYNGLKVLVCGMGPAGFTLSHHLLMEGFAVVGTEGLKIEPLPAELVSQPVRDWATLEEKLEERIMAGFGGVAEYGITVRWDKNFLKLIYLSLARRPHFQVFGGVRFGGTVTVEEAWQLGFDHVAIAVGAGLPQALPIPHSLARGMRQANDFLMSLQLTGAAKLTSLANLQIRLPAVVIGGGLTGIDTATEVQAYYVVQVEKTLARYESLCAALTAEKVRAGLDEESRIVLDEHLIHGRAVRAERERAAKAGETPNFIPLLRSWGGVTVAYRRAMTDSPAYTRNHEEITKAFEEGIFYAEALDPKTVKLDRFGHIETLVMRRQVRGGDGRWSPMEEEVRLPARCVLVATGARPNVAYEFEHKNHFIKERGHYQTHAVDHGTTKPIDVAEHCKDPAFGAFTSYHHDGRFVSFLGDTHPVFHGSVVKAVASGLRTYPRIAAVFGPKARAAGQATEYQRFRTTIDDRFSARIEQVRRLKPDVVELTVRAPQAARRFAPGQFFRLQNFEQHAPLVGGTRLHTEPLALVGSRVDTTKGTVSMIVFERGASARLVATLKPGEPVLLMGPTGVRTRISEEGDTVLAIGGRQAAATLLATGTAMRAHGNRVLFFALFDKADDVFLQEELEQAADTIVWVTRAGNPVTPRRASDRSLTGEITDALLAYARGELGGGAPIPMPEVNRLQILGDTALARTVRQLRHGELGKYLTGEVEAAFAVHGMMQCMLKGVCSQCLQWQIDPATGKRTKAVFACSWQDEPLDIVDLDNVDERQGQNRLQEHLLISGSITC